MTNLIQDIVNKFDYNATIEYINNDILIISPHASKMIIELKLIQEDCWMSASNYLMINRR